MRSVGIDIGTHSIKVVEVVQGSRGIVVQRFLEKTLGVNPAFDPELETMEFLRELALTYTPENTKIVVGLKQENVAVRNKIFPFLERHKILKSLAFELEEDLPFPSESSVFDAKVIRSRGPMSEVIACATPIGKVRSLYNKMQDASIGVSIISPEGLAYANCVEAWDAAPPIYPAQSLSEDSERPKTQVSLHVNIGHTRTLVSAFDGRSLVDVRSISWGTKDVAESVAKRYEIPLVEATKEVQTKSFILLNKESASYDQIVFSDTIAASFLELAKDLTVSILDFETQLNCEVENVYITGGGSKVINLHAFLTQALERPVNRLNLLSAFPQVNFERTPHVDAAIGVALGLAIEGLKKPRNPATNFLRGDLAPENQRWTKFIESWGPTLKIAGAAVVVLMIYSLIRGEIGTELAAKADESLRAQARSVARLPGKTANETGLRRYVNEQKKKAKALKDLTALAKVNSALDVLKKVSDAVPPRGQVHLDITRFAVEGRKVQIEGTVASAQEVEQLQKSLAGVAVGPIQRTDKANGTKGQFFSFAFDVDRGLQKR